jgi:hypothetical protein
MRNNFQGHGFQYKANSFVVGVVGGTEKKWSLATYAK